MPTTIEWTDETWNPVTGCVKVSPGCKHCYAETFAERFRGVVMPGGRLHVFHNGFDPQLRPDRLGQPFKWHTAKRAERLRDWTRTQPWLRSTGHIWLGVSVEDKRFGLPRMKPLREANAALRFLSIEPLLEDLGRVDLRGIDWVIVGGESGPGARPMDASWVRSIRDQCRRKGVSFFFKQWGGTRKHKTGRILDGRTWDELPSVGPLVRSA